MFSTLRRIFRPNVRIRRVLSGFCAAFMLATIAFSSLFVSVEADHDCAGHDCPICQEMQASVANFQLLGSSAPTCDSFLPAISLFAVARVPCARRAPATTLQTLDVRLDE